MKSLQRKKFEKVGFLTNFNSKSFSDLQKLEGHEALPR